MLSIYISATCVHCTCCIVLRCPKPHHPSALDPYGPVAGAESCYALLALFFECFSEACGEVHAQFRICCLLHLKLRVYCFATPERHKSTDRRCQEYGLSAASNRVVVIKGFRVVGLGKSAEKVTSAPVCKNNLCRVLTLPALCVITGPSPSTHIVQTHSVFLGEVGFLVHARAAGLLMSWRLVFKKCLMQLGLHFCSVVRVSKRGKSRLYHPCGCDFRTVNTLLEAWLG